MAKIMEKEYSGLYGEKVGDEVMPWAHRRREDVEAEKAESLLELPSLPEMRERRVGVYFSVVENTSGTPA